MYIQKHKFIFSFIAIILNLVLLSNTNAQKNTSNQDELEKIFINPPTSVKPYVWWHWMGSNYSLSGITKDLEAMKEMGIGGATIFNIASAVQESHQPILNNPWPNQTYRSTEYWNAIQHATREAKRLGLEIGLHNTAGYSTTGGPWICEDRAMQKLVWSSQEFTGGRLIDTILTQPTLPVYNGWGSNKKQATFYRDIAFLAVPKKDSLQLNEIINLTDNIHQNSLLTWNMPPGDWIVYRVGHAPTMANPHPLPDDIIGKSLEVDKMSEEQNKFHWNTVLQPLQQYLKNDLGSSFKHILIDSYEADAQNWTPLFKEEFIKRKGYDPIPWLITLNINGDQAIIIENTELTERFKWDFTDVISQLFQQNSWSLGKKMINDLNLQLYFEPYWGPFNIANGVTTADIPMGEFWTHWAGMTNIISPAARAAGKSIVAAEAFTGAPANSQYTEDPAFLKPTTNRAFAAGINRLILHTWVHQPFDDQYQPGMSMGWWGTHFGRHQTWAKPGKAFFTYIARSQALLQYGQQTADILALENSVDESMDIISTPDFLQQNIIVKNGKIVLQSGRAYSLLVLPVSQKILPEVIQKISVLVQNGASILGNKPTQAYGLKNYPHADSLVNTITKKLWSKEFQNTHGKGNVFTSLEDAKKLLHITPDIIIHHADSVKYISSLHRKNKNTDIYFITNLWDKPQDFTISFKTSGMQPELWNAEDGSIKDAPIWEQRDGRTWVQLRLQDFQSIFVVFRKPATSQNHITVIEKNHSSDIDILSEKGILYASSKQKDQIKLYYSNNTTKKILFSPAFKSKIDGPWSVTFFPKLDSSFSFTFDSLQDFSTQNQDRIRYFSGTAVYKKTLYIDPLQLSTSNQFQLDLGTMNDIASVKINNTDLGVLWYPPYTIDISNFIHTGNNSLEISVTNNWANRLIGDEQEPVDFEWGADRGELGRAMKTFPDWFLNHQPRPSSGRKSFLLWYYYRKESKLQPAGLAGPVTLLSTKKIRLN